MSPYLEELIVFKILMLEKFASSTAKCYKELEESDSGCILFCLFAATKAIPCLKPRTYTIYS